MPDLRERVEEVIVTTIHPLLHDGCGGNVELVEVGADGLVRVKFSGACAGCPMAHLTLKRGVEARLKRHVPEVTSVEAI